MTLFDTSLTHVLKWEGGAKYHKNPKDPGGGTKYGITSASYPHLDIRNLTFEVARDIYIKDYWSKIKADDMEQPMAFVAFDCSVNQGVTRAKKFLKETKEEQLPSLEAEVLYFMALRISHYVTLKDTWPYFGRGWMNRLQSTQKEACLLFKKSENVIGNIVGEVKAVNLIKGYAHEIGEKATLINKVLQE